MSLAVSSVRRQSRILAMQWLCQNDVQPGPVDETLHVISRDFRNEPDSIEYARMLCHRFVETPHDVDRRISSVMEHWELSRIDSVHRNILRVATVELMLGEEPPRAVLNEAIEIAREFGSSESPGFVNGILDAVWKNEGKAG